jgi:hypothetical protein
MSEADALAVQLIAQLALSLDLVRQVTADTNPNGPHIVTLTFDSGPEALEVYVCLRDFQHEMRKRAIAPKGDESCPAVP